MSKKVDKIRRQLDAKRKKRSTSLHQRQRSAPQIYQQHDEAREHDDVVIPPSAPKGKNNTESKQPLIRKDILLLQMMGSICLFLIVGILFQNPSPTFDSARDFIYRSMTTEFEFDTIAHWYEDQFGRPLALVPPTTNVALDQTDEPNVDYAYAVPASGTVSESFDQNGRGIFVETSKGSQVEAVKSGVVQFVGQDEEEEGIGKTVVVQHYDGGESWYGSLGDIDVNVHDHVETGDIVGTTSKTNGDREVYYFALKEDETFIDPLDVISFD
ncbi:M23 family metallopeptidase [Texcoconibacillus texcoconensis]|uniref:Stage IV sporulation protein FA n=1 Tax=Texcoconibacillus texcoconensis TaxID=1095777 RepID=A0A840QSA2_9BACI|nr:M23 family metallopeptidase [Texcoconibacillus texcoconensis]MBB5174382.1 stage IV sporulation protein FA [Texcoconibacillus texcoconensis]